MFRVRSNRRQKTLPIVLEKGCLKPYLCDHTGRVWIPTAYILEQVVAGLLGWGPGALGRSPVGLLRWNT